MLEIFKNGSKIHIKEKNKGKFTKYCNGKVTDECIKKAKASGNPTLIKRAVFAENARHFKHKKGSKIIVRFAQEGTKMSGLNNFLNSDSGKTIMSTAMSTIGNIGSTIKQNKDLNAQANATKAQNQANASQRKLQAFNKYKVNANNLYQQQLQEAQQNGTNASSIVAESMAYNQARNDFANINNDLSQQNKMVDAQTDAAKANNISNTFNGIFQNGMELFQSFMNNKSTPTSTTKVQVNVPTTQNYTTSSFWNNPTSTYGQKNQFAPTYK